MAEPTESAKGKNTGMAAIAYLIFFIPLLTDSKDDPFVKFHVKQGLILLLFSVLVSIVSTFIPFIGLFFVAPIGGIVTVILFVIGIMHAMNGEEKELPLIGSLAKNLKF